MNSIQLDSFQRWREARQQLDDALLHLHKTTNELDATLSGHSMDPELLEKASMEADQVSCTMPTRIENLKAIHVTLNKIRNRSTSLVPINKLPLEILLQILQFSVQEHHGLPYDYYMSSQLHQAANKTLFSLTHMCTRWRSLVIANTSFWSKIFLDHNNATDLSVTCNRVRTYLERAHDQPLDVDLHGGGISSQNEVTMIDTLLQRHLKYIRTLRLMGFQSPDTLLTLITSLLTHGQPGSVHTLIIWSVHERGFPARIYPTNRGLTQRRIDSILLPVQFLYLGGVYFDWDSKVYHNLVRLQISGLTQERSPTLRQVQKILSACPELETLRLQNLHILASEGAPLEPVTLTKLMELDIMGMNSEGVSLLLPMLISPLQELSARIDLYPDASYTSHTIQSFLSRTNITRLYISDSASPDGIARYLSAVTNLKVLILDLFLWPNDHILTHLTHVPQSTSKRTAISPKLSTLYLMNGTLRNETVQAVVRTHPVLQKLHFIDCFLKPSYEQLLRHLKNVDCTTRLGPATYWYRTLI